MKRKHIRWTEQQLNFLLENYGKTYTEDIAKTLGFTQSKVIHKAYELGIKSNLTRRFSESIHAAIRASGNLPLAHFTSPKQKIHFQCFHCGRPFVTTPEKIASKHTKSCGCVSIGKRQGGRFISKTVYHHIKNGAFTRGLEFSLSITYLDELLENQNFRCSLSGRTLIYGYRKRSEYTASVDRIESTLGYVPGNVQFVHKDVNMAKQSMSQQDFISLCREVAATCT